MITKEALWPGIEMGATVVTRYFTKPFYPIPFFYLIRLVLAQALDSNMTKLELCHSDTGVAETSYLSCVGDTNFALEGRMRVDVTRRME